MEPTPPSGSFTEADTQRDEMQRVVTNWFDSLARELDSGDGHDRVHHWLDVQSTFPRETARNALLIALQDSDAERVASEQVWNEEYEREVCADAEPIWLWDPTIEPCCPGCDLAVADHDRSDCGYDGLDIEHWPRVVVGYTPFPVYDVPQTEGRRMPSEAPPSVQTATTRFTRLLAAAPRLGIDTRVVPGSEWSHGQREARFAGPAADGRQRVDLRQREGGPCPTEAVVQAYATARLHAVSVPDVTIGRRADAVAVAEIVHEAHEHPTDMPSLELGAWQDDCVEALRTRLQRISRVGVDLIEAIRRPELLAPP